MIPTAYKPSTKDVGVSHCVAPPGLPLPLLYLPQRSWSCSLTPSVNHNACVQLMTTIYQPRLQVHAVSSKISHVHPNLPQSYLLTLPPVLNTSARIQTSCLCSTSERTSPQTHGPAPCHSTGPWRPQGSGWQPACCCCWRCWCWLHPSWRWWQQHSRARSPCVGEEGREGMGVRG